MVSPVDFTSQSSIYPMGYIQDLRSTLEAKLAALPEPERAAIADFIVGEVLTSYRNGQRDATQNRPTRKRGERSAKPDRKRQASSRGRDNYKRE